MFALITMDCCWLREYEEALRDGALARNVVELRVEYGGARPGRIATRNDSVRCNPKRLNSAPRPQKSYIIKNLFRR